MSRKVSPASNERVGVGAIRPVKSIPATRVLPALTSSVPPAGSLAALQSPSGDRGASVPPGAVVLQVACVFRSEEHTSELQSLMRISYAVFCLKKKKEQSKNIITSTTSPDTQRIRA